MSQSDGNVSLSELGIISDCRVIVTGSRDWPDDGFIPHTLSLMRAELGDWISMTIVHGACPTGADAQAEAWAVAHGQTVERHPADWSKGRSAGPIRNREMVMAGAKICAAFILNGSKGASGCADLAERHGIFTYRWRR